MNTSWITPLLLNPLSTSPPSIGFGTIPQQQSMQTTTTQTNSNYKAGAREFVDRYSSASFFSLTCIDPHYAPDSLISLTLFKGGQGEAFEFRGPVPFREKMASLNASSIKYSDLTITAQPFGNQSALISVHGKAEINYTLYPISCTFMIKVIDSTPKIAHQILEVFM